MILYGDHSVRIMPAELMAALLDAARTASSGSRIACHGHLVAALIAAGQITTAYADATHAAGPADPTERGLMHMTWQLAGAVSRSWNTGLAPEILDFGAVTAYAELGPLVLKEPEGYAHYAVYPEGFGAAAAAWAAGDAPRVIGIRSIGTSLAAMVASQVGAPPPVTVRPVGHPFDRHLDLAPDHIAVMGLGSATAVAVVDEGPGLSGSSFGAVGDMLDAQGVDPARVVFFPSHANEPGEQCSPRHLSRFRSTRRLLREFDALVLETPRPEHRLAGWFVDLTGAASKPLADIAGGRWRALLDPDETRWPPADPAAERRKFLIDATGGRFLLKFAGLGRSGAGRAVMQARLAAAGFTTTPLAWRHGFTLEPWRNDLTPLRPGLVDRAALVARLGTYLGFRAAYLPAEGRSGASLEALCTMARANAGEALGPEAGQAIEAWRARLTALGSSYHPVATDNRLHRWEWLIDREGRLVKTDAVDHHAAHDLIGCQDIAWDVAGAASEFGLDEDEVDRVCHSVARFCGRAIRPELLAFCRIAYPAFQLGAAHLAGGRSEEADRRRWAAEAGRYEADLLAALA